MPGETLSFMVTAFDQAGNQQPAVWSITENNENQSERQVIGDYLFIKIFFTYSYTNYYVCVG